MSVMKKLLYWMNWKTALGEQFVTYVVLVFLAIHVAHVLDVSNSLRH